MKPSGKLVLLAWEMTRACGFACPHCRASNLPDREQGELSTEEGAKLLREAAKVGPGIIILSGGEPLIRQDLEQLAKIGTEAGHIVVVACNDGRLLTDARIKSLKESGVKRFSFSMHSHRPEVYDTFMGIKGTFQHALDAFKRLQSHGMGFQVNTTVLPNNHKDLPAILQFAKDVGAAAWHTFFVVSTGRAEGKSGLDLTDQQTEEVLTWIANIIDEPNQIQMKVTCAPQFNRILVKMGKKLPRAGKSCMAGDGFAFVSSHGDVKPCGYFDVIAGNVRKQPFDEIYSKSPLFLTLRDSTKLEDKCGFCEYRMVCGGCRARAYSQSGNYMSVDPSCSYTPKLTEADRANGGAK